MSGEVWRHLTFAEAVDINPKRALHAGAVVPYVEMAAVPKDGGTIEYLLEREVGGGGAKFQNGDTLFARITPCAENGKTAFVDCLRDGETGLGSTELIVFGPKRELTDPEYIYHLARSELVRGPAISQMVGTTGRARVPNTVFDEISIPLPPLHEQRRIAEILSSADEVIAATRAVIEQTRKVKQGVLERLLTRGIGHTRFKQTEIGEIPEAWSLKSIGDIANVKAGATPSRALHDRYFASGHIPWVKTGDLTNGEIAETEEMITDAAVAESSCEVHLTGTVLVAMYGGFQQIGRSGILMHPSATNQAISALRLRDQTVLGTYLNLALVGLRPKWRMVAASSRKDPNITKDDVLRFKVPVPPLAEQQQIIELMTGAADNLRVLEDELLRLMECKSALMSDLLTGCKRVTDAVPMAAE